MCTQNVFDSNERRERMERTNERPTEIKAVETKRTRERMREKCNTVIHGYTVRQVLREFYSLRLHGFLFGLILCAIDYEPSAAAAAPELKKKAVVIESSNIVI